MCVGDGGDDSDCDIGDGYGGGDDDVDEPRRPNVSVVDTNAKLMRQYLEQSLRQYSFYSMPVRNEEGGAVEDAVFQILNTAPKCVLVKSHRDVGKDTGLFDVVVQPWQVWHSPTVGSSHHERSIFMVEEPILLDIVSLLGTSLESRCQIFEWTQSGESDVFGCLRLHSPRLARLPMTLKSPFVPVLSLLDALNERGFSPILALCEHSDEQTQRYDFRSVMTKRSYYQCVLFRSDLARRGNGVFTSGRSQAYYQLLLSSATAVPANLTALECNTRKAAISDAMDGLLQLADIRPPSPKRLRGERLLAIVDQPVVMAVCDGESDDDRFGGWGGVSPEPEVPSSSSAAGMASREGLVVEGGEDDNFDEDDDPDTSRGEPHVEELVAEPLPRELSIEGQSVQIIPAWDRADRFGRETGGVVLQRCAWTLQDVSVHGTGSCTFRRQCRPLLPRVLACRA